MHHEQSHLESASVSSQQVETSSDAYEAPAVETVLTPESLEREVHYAGIVIGSGQAPA